MALPFWTLLHLLSSPLPVTPPNVTPLSTKLLQPCSSVLLIRRLPPAVSTHTKERYTSETLFSNSALCWQIFHNCLFWLFFCIGTGNLFVLSLNFLLHTNWYLTSKSFFYRSWECTALLSLNGAVNTQCLSVCFPSSEQQQQTLDPTQGRAGGTVISHLMKCNSLFVEWVWGNLVVFM